MTVFQSPKWWNRLRQVFSRRSRIPTPPAISVNPITFKKFFRLKLEDSPIYSLAYEEMLFAEPKMTLLPSSLEKPCSKFDEKLLTYEEGHRTIDMELTPENTLTGKEVPEIAKILFNQKDPEFNNLLNDFNRLMNLLGGSTQKIVKRNSELGICEEVFILNFDIFNKLVNEEGPVLSNETSSTDEDHSLGAAARKVVVRKKMKKRPPTPYPKKEQLQDKDEKQIKKQGDQVGESGTLGVEDSDGAEDENPK